MTEDIEADSTGLSQLSLNDNGINTIIARTNHISWDDFFMGAAMLAAQRSKDPKRQVGACIVSPDNIIVALGYNGMPRGCNDNEFPWDKSSDDYENKLTYVVHAEVNAIINKNAVSLKGCRLYVSLFPCNECSKIIIQSGITKIFYLTEQKKIAGQERVASRRLLNAAGIEYKQHIPENSTILIDFNAA